MTILHRFCVPLLFFVGIVFRLIDLNQPFRGVYAWNEAYYSIIAANFFHYGWRQQWGPDGPLFTSNPLVPWLIALCFRVFGLHEWAARLPFFLCSVVSLISVYGLACCAFPSCPHIARLCLLFAATMPGLVFFSRNVQLDGPMTAAGLLGLWLAAYAARTHKKWPLALSVLAMALCVTFKYTGILAFPAWWVALGLTRVQWRRGLALSVLAILPAAVFIHWVSALQAASHVTVHGLTTRSYFFRFSEWKPSAFARAFQATWDVQPSHWGAVLWFPFLCSLPLALALATPARLRQYRLIPAMVLPWYLQIAYPASWVMNEYYDYFALYGIALGLALVADAYAARLNASRAAFPLPRWSAALAAALVIVCNVWQYRQTFHQTYFPFDVVAEASPFASAKMVHALDTDRAPILTDQSQTMFYADPNPAVTTHIWWRENEAAFDAAIHARAPKYVVVEYLPAVGTVEALDASGYRQIAPGAWERKGE